MTSETIFRVLFWILFGGVLLMRGYFMSQVRETGERFMPDEQAIAHEGKGLFAFRLASWFLMIAVLISYALNRSWLETFRIAFPDWLRWAGFVLGIISILFWTWTHMTLGKEWSPQLKLREKHHLVTSGPYTHIRHPMYTAISGFGLSLALVATNGVFVALAIVVIIGLFLRIPEEEKMLIGKFGEEYQAYKRHTGRLFPQ